MGDRVRRARYSRDLSVRDVAAALNVSPNAVHQWEMGSRPKAPEMRKRLAKLYDVPEEILFREYADRLAELAASVLNGSS